MTQPERERLAVLETQVALLIRQQEAHATLLREVRDAVVSSRGAKWALVTLISAAGVAGGIVGQFFPR